MTAAETPWTATIRIVRADPASAERVERALRPEAAREVPRSRATLRRPTECTVELEVTCDGSGPLRAAMNAYLGWVRLALESEQVAQAAGLRRPR